MDSRTQQNSPEHNQQTRALFGYFGILVLLVIWVESLQNQNLFWGPLHDSAHAFAFFLLTRLLTLLHSKLASTGTVHHDQALPITSGLVLAKIGGACFALGIVIEITQPLFGRSASFNDISYNFFGILSAITYEISKHQQTALKLALKSITIILLTSALFIPLSGAYTLKQRQDLLPFLLDFEHRWQQRIYRAGGKANLSLTHDVAGWPNTSTSLKVDFVQTTYPGFSIPHVSGDWSGYSYLSVEVYSKLKAPKNLTLRIHDKHHTHEHNDRFNRTVEIQPGHTTIQISLDEMIHTPKTRALDIENIAGIGVFSSNPTEDFSLYFDNFKLVKESKEK